MIISNSIYGSQFLSFSSLLSDFSFSFDYSKCKSYFADLIINDDNWIITVTSYKNDIQKNSNYTR